MDLTATFAAMPGAQPAEGIPGGWIWRLGPVSAHLALVSKDGEHALKTFALSTYDAALGHELLRFAGDHADELFVPAEQPFAIAEGFSCPGHGFDLVVSVSPAIHRFKLDDQEVHDATREFFLAYRCEVAGTEDEQDAGFRYLRAPGIQTSTWNREPNPCLRMRMRTETREIKERGFAPLRTLVVELGRIPDREGGFVEFENYQNRVWTVTFSGDRYVVAEEGGEEQRFDQDGVIEFAAQVLYGPNREAGTSEMFGG
ncbi:hypothetical protein D5S17_15435 [Pseudonocardiaceae bacterium YIM PH 21723]|nr:hypothetical protein D5S17_15435 [Pseudonocardiaceae bacterium YIM PH 21723]